MLTKIFTISLLGFLLLVSKVEAACELIPDGTCGPAYGCPPPTGCAGYPTCGCAGYGGCTPPNGASSLSAQIVGFVPAYTLVNVPMREELAQKILTQANNDSDTPGVTLKREALLAPKSTASQHEARLASNPRSDFSHVQP